MTMLDADRLRRQYGSWGSHPEHPIADWQCEVANDETRLGYWEWLENKLVVLSLLQHLEADEDNE